MSLTSPQQEVREGSHALYQRLLHVLQLPSQDQQASEEGCSSLLNKPDDEENAQKVVSQWKAFSTEATVDEIIPIEKVGLISRACKNWLRWYLQIYCDPSLAKRPQRDRLRGQEDDIILFKSKHMLELYMLLVDHFSLVSKQPEIARNMALILFYGTFNPITSSDGKGESTFAFLMNDCHFFPRMMQILISIDFVPLCVTISRNIHNVVASYPAAVPMLQKATIARPDTTTSSSGASWISETTKSNGDLTIPVIFYHLLEYALSERSSTTPFPGNEARGDLRAELVQEILRIFYAIRLGQTLHTYTKDPPLVRIVCRILNLKNNDDDDDDDSGSKLIVDCKMAAVTVLIDSGAEMAQLLMHSHNDNDDCDDDNKNTVKSLLELFEHQLSETLEKKRVDDAGSTALIPLLVVLYKFCQANKEFLESTTNEVFPVEAEPQFRLLVEQQEQAQAETGGSSKAAKNMSPLDAPKGSLRYKLIQLLTWPHSQTKRFAEELLWMLCKSDPQEFVYRVGMGNALPLLSMKGFAQMPAQVYS
ncbi:hypothetical protein ACA910_004853 [Epithemia clementina (nom. ined.)]